MSSNDSNIKHTDSEAFDVFFICQKMNMTPKKMQEGLEKEMERGGFNPDTDVGRMVSALKNIRGMVYRMNVPDAMKAIQRLT